MPLARSRFALPLVDRNSLPSGMAFRLPGLAPHSTTTRTQITVAAGRRLWVMSSNLTVRRITAAAPAGVAFSRTSGVVWDIEASLSAGMNAAKDQHQVSGQGPVPVEPGDTVTLQTSDASTGGTIDYYGTLNGLLADL